MPAGNQFDDQSTRRIAESVRWTEWQTVVIGDSTPAVRSSGSPINWLRGYNAAGETIPAYSVVAIRAGSTIDNGYRAHLEKPSTTFCRDYGITVSQDLSAGKRGGYSVEAGLVKYDTGTPATGETWGPKPGQFTVSKNYPGFRCLGVIDSTNKIMLAVREEPPFYLAKADAAISKGSSGTASLYVGASGSETDSTINITNCRAKWGAIATGKWCGVSFVNGVPYITQLEC